MTLSSQKLNQVGSIFLLVLFLLCELSGHTTLHCTCLDSAYQYHGETIIRKFTIIKKSPQNTEIVQCGDTQELFLCPTIIKPYHIPIYFITLDQSCFYCVTHCTNLPGKKKSTIRENLHLNLKQKGLGKRKKTTHNVIVKPQVSGIYN